MLTDVSLVLSPVDRVGLIGENGSGKSTLLSIIAGLRPPDTGRVTATAPGTPRASIGLLRQEPPFSAEETVGDAVERAVEPGRAAADRVALLAAELAERPEDPRTLERYSDALATAERLDVWGIDARRDRTLAGLGLAALERSRATAELSGGQRARLSLAWLLLSGPDVLLLDEPTNHLDEDATAHLVGVLQSWPGPVLMASHDRAFLEQAATSLIDLDPSPAPHADSEGLIGDGDGTGIGVTRFTGGFGEYLDARHAARRRWERRYEEEQDELTRLRAAVGASSQVGHSDWRPRTETRAAAKFYADRNARVVSRRLTEARSRLDALERSRLGRPPEPLRFRGLTAAGTPRDGHDEGPLIAVTNITVPERLSPTSLALRREDRLLITGANGSGKSTLIGVLAARITPDGGTRLAGPRARIAELTQDTALPDPRRRGPGRTVRECYADLVDVHRAERTPIETFGLIAHRDLNRALSALSVGQRRRVALAVLLADPPDVLLLDEPTNHLSLALVTELEAAIGDYPGAVVVASHDRWLRDRWTGTRLHLTAPPHGKVAWSEG
ncbi:putative ABC transporter ATP-binding protein [Mycetocola reblochoni REB411]|uniref:Putative ABC transporter ATP-binding protein n=1 Tax=Mycetocola reblochoni REB411 TaxID=1255698 RepID=A0A1R4K5Z0_9MICO|nr:putative ABC transporter ATP-binding protein [Mycetocola reblochoni REB411]